MTDAPQTDGRIDDPGDTLGMLVDALSNPRRRAVIRYLANEPRVCTLDEITDAIADLETDGRVGSQDRKRVYVSLYQTHLDALEEANIITTDSNGHEIWRGIRFNQARAVLQAAEDSVTERPEESLLADVVTRFVEALR